MNEIRWKFLRAISTNVNLRILSVNRSLLFVFGEFERLANRSGRVRSLLQYAAVRSLFSSPHPAVGSNFSSRRISAKALRRSSATAQISTMMAISRFVGNADTRDLRTTLIPLFVVLVGLSHNLSASGMLLPESFNKGTLILWRCYYPGRD